VHAADGSRYEGELVEGQRNGYGRLSFASIPLVYEGQWRQGKRHGQGTLYYDAGRATYYQGGGTSSCSTLHTVAHCMAGPRCPRRCAGHTSTLLTTPAGSSASRSACRECQHCNRSLPLAAGDWLDDERHGCGKVVYPSGNHYSGQWQHGVKAGWGSMVRDALPAPPPHTHLSSLTLCHPLPALCQPPCQRPSPAPCQPRCGTA
jgi:hypothetical protein